MANEFARAAKALRLGAGLSLAELAKRANYSKAAIGHAETGRHPPTPELARAIDSALGANGLLIALAAAIQDSRRSVMDVNRREMLATIALSSASLGTSSILDDYPPSRRIGPYDLAHLRDRTSQLRRLDDRLGGGDTYHLYLTEIDATETILNSRITRNRAEESCFLSFQSRPS